MSNLNYIVAASAILIFGVGLIFLPEKVNKKELDPQEMLLELQNARRLVDVEDITDRMVNEDPSLILVDVRDSLAFEDFTLPGAINIPLENILDTENDDYFGREELDIVLFSNDHFLAEKAWVLQKRQNENPLFILEGGLNQWTKEILLAEAPPENASNEVLEAYAFRAGARKFFVGASKPIAVTTAPPIVVERPKKSITVLPKKVEKKRRLEGC